MGVWKKGVSETIGSYQTWHFDSTLDTWSLAKMSSVEQTAVDLRIYKRWKAGEKNISRWRTLIDYEDSMAVAILRLCWQALYKSIVNYTNSKTKHYIIFISKIMISI